MDKAQPFLLKRSVTRTFAECESGCQTAYYDNDLMVTVVEIDGKKIPAVLLPGFAGAQTKKADMEKGDDMKDNGPPAPPRPRPNPKPGR